MTRRFLLALLLCSLGAAAGAAAARAYPWPVRPFDRQHPIRGSFGDPRTLFEDPFYADGINGPGSFSFHNGVDISAPNDTDVYPVAGGIAHLLDSAAVAVDTLDGRTFQYYHVIPHVIDGERVRASETVLGTIEAPYAHVHLSEIDGGHIANPLQRGHLTPYRDRTRPSVESIELRNTFGRRISPLGVCGRIAIVADAQDTPALPVPGSFAGLPVAPAFVAWRLDRVGHGAVVPTTTVADFRRTLPAPRDFWSVYARGTYENAPRFGPQQFSAMPGRFLYLLDASLDTKKLRNGLYAAHVIAEDARGNTGSLTERFWVLNVRSPTGCPTPPAAPAVRPAPPPVTTTATTTTTSGTTTTTTTTTPAP